MSFLTPPFSRRTVPSWLEWIFAIATLVFATSTLGLLLTGSLEVDVDPTLDPLAGLKGNIESSSLLSFIQVAILGTLLFLISLHWQSVLQAILKRRFIWLYALLATMSFLWSDIPEVTFRKGLWLLITTLIGVYIGSRFTVREQIQLLGWALGITALLNFGFTIALPSYTIHIYDHPGAWRGLLSQKNSLARLMVVSAVVFGLWWIDTPRSKRLWIGLGGLLSIALVHLTTSKTGLLILILLLVAIPSLKALRSRRPLTLVTFLMIFLTVAIVSTGIVGNYEAVLISMGRDPTFTGRTGIWEVIFDRLARNPLFGYGHRGFWRGLEGDSADVVYRIFIDSGNGHNGFLDILIELGYVGLTILIVDLLKNFQRAFVWLRLTPGSEGIWPLLFIMCFMLYNLTESTDPSSFQIFWIVYVALTTTVVLHPLPDRLPRERTLQNLEHFVIPKFNHRAVRRPSSSHDR